MAKIKKAKRPTKAHTVPARGRVQLSAGEMVRVIRELQEMTQTDLAAVSGIAQGTISSIEVGRASLGVERAERLARALKVHPAVLLWPDWDAKAESKRAG